MKANRIACWWSSARARYTTPKPRPTTRPGYSRSARAARRRPPPPAEDLAPKRTTTGRTTRPFAREPHTQLWQKLLRAARDARASDLHIVAARPPLHRVAGQIVAQGDALDPLVVEDMVLSRVPSRLAPAQTSCMPPTVSCSNVRTRSSGP